MNPDMLFKAESEGVVMVGLDHFDIIDHFVNKSKWEWAYMGSNPVKREKISAKLISGKRYSYAKELQEISLSLKESFIDWISEFGAGQEKLMWWGTDVSCKSPYLSDLYLHFCFLMLIGRWIGQRVRKRLIIVENPWVLRSCLKNYHGKTTFVIENKIRFNLLKTLLLIRVCVGITAFIFRSLRLWATIRACCFFRLSHLKRSHIEAEADVFICTYAEDRSFEGQSCEFRDPYFETLIEFYRKNGARLSVVTMPFAPPHLLRQICKSRRNNIIPSAYFIKITDIVKSVFLSLTHRWKHTELTTHNGYDFKDILSYELVLERTKACYSLLHYFVWLNLGEALLGSEGIPFIYLFEGQPWERMMLAGFRKSGANIRFVGYQHTVIPPLLLNYFWGKHDHDKMYEPEIVSANGDYWASVLRKNRFSSRIENGGSVRFSPLREYPENDSGSVVLGKRKTCLVLLSASKPRSLDFYFEILKLSQNMEDMDFLLKPHPDLPKEAYKKYTKDLPSNMSFTDIPLNSGLLKRVDFAIHTGTAAVLECLVEGVICLKFLQELIDLDPLLDIDRNQEVITFSDLGYNFFSQAQFRQIDNLYLGEPLNKEFWKSTWRTF